VRGWTQVYNHVMLTLVGANLNYSSWTWRAWLALQHAGVPFRFFDVGLKTKENWKDTILSFSGAGRVPVLVDGSLSVHESLAICEYVAELAPEARLWPADVKLRARGRAISCEMLSGFAALRSACPTNFRGRAKSKPTLSAAAESDIRRILGIWEASLVTADGPFLLGQFSIADCMYFPVATRFRTYGIELPGFAQRYSETLFQLPIVQKLAELGRNEVAIAEYDDLLV
jgi:glutathione S-transferase